jgi:hypothetical protein
MTKPKGGQTQDIAGLQDNFIRMRLRKLGTLVQSPGRPIERQNSVPTDDRRDARPACHIDLGAIEQDNIILTCSVKMILGNDALHSQSTVIASLTCRIRDTQGGFWLKKGNSTKRH